MMNLGTEDHGKIGQSKLEDTTIYLIVTIMELIVNVLLKKRT